MLRHKKYLKLIFVNILFSLFVFNSLCAIDYTWTNAGGTGNWNTATNWSPPTGPPNSSTDNAIFDTTSTANCSMNTAPSIGNITFETGYTGDFDLNSNTLDVKGAATFVTGMTVSDTGGAGKIEFTGSSCSITSAGLTIPEIEYSSTGTLTLQDALTVTDFDNSSTGTVDLNGKNLTAATSFANSGGGTIEFHGPEVLSLPTIGGGDADGTWKCVGDGSSTAITIDASFTDVDNVEFDDTGTTFTLSAPLVVAGTFTVTAGTVDLSTFILSVTGAVSVENAGTVKLVGSQTVILTSGNDTNSGTWEYYGTGAGANMILYSFGATDYFNLTINDTGSTPDSFYMNGAITLGAGTMTITSGQVYLDGNNLDVSGGTFDNDDTLAMRGTETFTGTMDVAGGTVKYVGTPFGSGAIALPDIAAAGGTDYFNFKIDLEGSSSNTFSWGNTALVCAGSITLVDSTLAIGANQIGCTTGWTSSGGSATFTTGIANFIGPQTITDTNTTFNDIVINSTGAGDTITLGSNITASTDFTMTDGDLALGGYTLIIGNDLVHTVGTVTNGTMKFDGSSDGGCAVDTLGSAFDDIEVSGGTATFASGVDIDGNLTLSGTGRVDLSANLEVDGNITHAAGTTLDLNTFDLTLGGNWDNSAGGTLDAAGQAGSTINFDGTTTFTDSTTTFVASFVLNGTSLTLADDINLDGDFTLTTGTLSLDDDTLNFAGSTWTYTAGTVTAGTGTIDFDAGGAQTFNTGAQSYYNITTTGGATALAVNSALTVTNTLTNAGTITLNDTFTITGTSGTLANTGTIDFNGQTVVATSATITNVGGTFQFDGDESITGFTNDTSNGTTTFRGDSSTATTYTNVGSGITGYNNLAFTSAITGDTFTLGAALDVAGNLTISANTTLDVSSSDYQINIEGNWSNSGTFTSQNGAVVFDGTGTTHTVAGDTAFYNFTCAVAADGDGNQTLTFSNTATQTIEGRMTITGFDANDRVIMQSDSGGDQWELTVNGSYSITLATVSDSNASGGSTIIPTNTSNGGNNTSWTFSLASASVSFASQVTGGTGAVTVAFTLGTALTAGAPGTFEITFPSGFSIDSGIAAANVTVNGVASAGVSVSSRTLTVTIPGNLSAGDAVSVVIASGYVTNPSTSAISDTFTIEAKEGGTRTEIISNVAGVGFSAAPTLSYEGSNGYETDGTDIDSFTDFDEVTFLVKYTDSDNDAPSQCQVCIDYNNNGTYEDFECFDMTTTDTSYNAGVTYSYTAKLYANSNENGLIRYKFTFKDALKVSATGDPVGAFLDAHKITTATSGTLPTITLAQSSNYTNGAYVPDDEIGVQNEFRAMYQDLNGATGLAPDEAYVFVDANFDANFTSDERFALTQFGTQTDYTKPAQSGVRFEKSLYTFKASSSAVTLRWFFEFANAKGYVRTATQTASIGPTGGTDTDGDGVSDREEEKDGIVDTDGDGTKDSADADSGVVELPDGSEVGFAMASGTNNITATNVSVLDANDTSTLNQAGRPTGVTFPDGLLQFTAAGVDVGGTLSLTLTLPSSTLDGDSLQVYKYNSYTDKWIEVDHTAGDDPETQIVIEVTDGGEGDSDGLTNGLVTDPVGIGGVFGGGSSGLFGGGSSSSSSGGSSSVLGLRSSSGGGVCLIAQSPITPHYLIWVFAIASTIMGFVTLKKLKR